MLEFLAMGGYALYVWSAFGVTLVVLAGNWWFARRRHAQIIATLRRSAQVDSPEAQPGFKEVMT
ncbi:MAG: heme exporter protein CcmD [Pseudomonadota bacterium]